MRSTRPEGPHRHLALFFVIACAFSWLNWGLVIASGRGWLPFRFPLNPWGSFGPAVAALVVTAMVSGRPGIRALLRPIGHGRFGWRWWIVTLLGPTALVALATFLYAMTGGTVLPAAEQLDVAPLVLMSVLLLFLGGPLGEEIGWRGYALPRWLERTGPVTASLLVAGMWALWHLPLFWLPDSAQAGSSIPLFVALVVAFSILTTWVYLATGKSLLAAILFHQSINLSTYFLPTVFPALDSTHGVDRMLLAVTGVAAGCAVWAMSRSSRPRTDSTDRTVP